MTNDGMTISSFCHSSFNRSVRSATLWFKAAVYHSVFAARYNRTLAGWLTVGGRNSMRLNLRSLWHYRPRVLTLVVLLLIAALLVLANLSDDLRQRRTPVVRVNGSQTFLPRNLGEWPFDVGEPKSVGGAWNMSYGWPLLWNQYVTLQGYGVIVVGWRYSAARLAGNIGIWLVMLVLPAAICEWLLRRYRPRFRWSLRTMLGSIGLVAVLCGWFAWARDRASQEHALTEAITQQHGQVWFERWGPQWLDMLGADRYRRRIVAVQLVVGAPQVEVDHNESGQRLIERLSELHHLHFLDFKAETLTTDMAGALGDLDQLHALSVNSNTLFSESIDAFGRSVSKMKCLRTLHISPGPSFTEDDQDVAERCLAAVAKAPQIERLRLVQMAIRPETLEHLASLTNLRSLTLDELSPVEGEASHATLLSRLPSISQLETLDLEWCDLTDHDLGYLARLPKLMSLCLAAQEDGLALAGVKQLASLRSLQEVTLRIDLFSSQGVFLVEALEALPALPHLSRLHIPMQSKQPAGLSGSIELVPRVDNESEAKRALLALEALRKARPGIVIEENSVGMGGREQSVIPAEYDTANRVRTLATRESIRQWKAAGCPPYPPPPGTPGQGVF
jgi:hypothetical protein